MKENGKKSKQATNKKLDDAQTLSQKMDSTSIPVWSSSNISGSVTYNTENFSSPTIESSLKFERKENYYTLETPVVLAGQTEHTEYKVVSNSGCSCGGECKKKVDKCNHEIDGSKSPKKSNFFIRFIKKYFS